jgi:hypothetical protein
MECFRIRAQIRSAHNDIDRGEKARSEARELFELVRGIYGFKIATEPNDNLAGRELFNHADYFRFLRELQELGWSHTSPA